LAIGLIHGSGKKSHAVQSVSAAYLQRGAPTWFRWHFDLARIWNSCSLRQNIGWVSQDVFVSWEQAAAMAGGLLSSIL
jgi:hypothetical protein